MYARSGLGTCQVPQPGVPMYYPACGVGDAQAVKSVSFTNLTRGNNAALQVGDQWSVEVHGAPNAQVTVTGSRDGKAYTWQPVGTTDATGYFRMNGSALADLVGQWFENWQVGGVGVGSFSFSISPVSSTPTVPPTPPAPVVNGFEIPASLPSWAWFAAAGALGLVLLGGKQ